MPSTQHTVLIVEDEAPIALLERRALESAGFATEVVNTGAAALERLKAGNFDLALLDHRLPDLTSTELVARLGDRVSRLPVVVATAHGDERLAVELLKAGVADYLIKDTELRFVREIPKTVRAAIHRFGLATENRALQTELRKAYSELERRVEERTNALSLANRRLQQEVRDRKQIERDLRDNFTLLNGVVEGTTDAVFMKDMQSRYVLANSAALRAMGKSREEVIGKNDADVFSPKVAAKLRTADLETIESGKACTFEEHTYVAGEPCDWMVTKVPYIDQNGNTVGLIGVARNITERKRSLEALRESEARFKQLSDTIDDVFWVTEWKNQRIVFVSPAYEKIWGRPVQDLHAYPKNRTDAIHPDDRNEAWRHFDRLNLAEPYDTEYRIIRPDGSIRWVRDRGFPIRDEHGQMCRVAGIAQDITDRKLAEEEKENLESQLRQAQKMEAVGQLAGGVAHDFNNILTSIVGNLELSLGGLRSRLGVTDPLLSGLAEVEQSAQRATKLTRQLLAFSRRQITKPTVLNLNKTLSEMNKMLRRLVAENIELNTMLAEGLRPILADAGQIEQIIMNLVINARDAMPTGGRLTLETANVTLDDTYCATHAEAHPGPHVLLTISDTGTGMDAETRDRVFEPFFTTKQAGEGSGLGLSMTYGIVRQAGGHIAVYSEPERGSTFNIYLPAIGTPDTVSPPTPTSDHFATGNEIVLVCEDDDAVRNLTVQMLQRAGYAVLSANNGAEAIRLAATYQPDIDLLITDVVMPNMNGRKLAETLSTTRPDMKTLYISGYTADVIAHHGVLEPEVEFLEKPFTLRGLLRRVRQVLDKAPAESPS